MKKIKRLAAFLLAMVMVLAMAMPAMAANEKIKISVPENAPTDTNDANETYIAYKIFTATKSSTPVEGIAYFLSAESPWKGIATAENVKPYLNFTEALDGSGWTVSWNTYSETNQNGKVHNEESAKELASLLSAMITEENGGYKVGDNVLGNNDYYVLAPGVEKEVEIGYYLITSSLGSNLILATTDIEINEKNDYPTVDKKIVTDAAGTEADEADAQIGDTVTFKLTAKIPAEATKKVVLHDTMSSGLTLKLDTTTFTVMAGEEEVAQKTNEKDNWTVQYSNSLVTTGENEQAGVTSTDLSSSTDSFVVTFTEDYIKTLSADTTLTVTYKAVLNNNAVLKDGTSVKSNDNTVKLDYSNFTTQEVTTKVYTYEFDLVKYSEAESTKTLLAGAQFKLYKADQVGEDGKLKEDPTSIKFVQAENNYKVYDGVTTTDDVKTTDTLTSVANSVLNIQGLDEGDYYIQEIKAPDGYNMLDTLVKVTVSATKDETTKKINGNNVAYGTISNSSKNANVEGTTYKDGGVGILNQSGSVLPSTGGIGTTIFYIVGGILVVGAGVILVTRRRMGK